jgi:hypothetical protein
VPRRASSGISSSPHALETRTTCVKQVRNSVKWHRYWCS